MEGKVSDRRKHFSNETILNHMYAILGSILSAFCIVVIFSIVWPFFKCTHYFGSVVLCTIPIITTITAIAKREKKNNKEYRIAEVEN